MSDAMKRLHMAAIAVCQAWTKGKTFCEEGSTLWDLHEAVAAVEAQPPAAQAVDDLLDWKESGLSRGDVKKLEARIAVLEGALQEIIAIRDAYPESIFKEPDWKMVNQVLSAGGITLDSISASNMRHVAVRTAEIAAQALSGAAQ